MPIYIGEGAARVLAEASFFSPVGASLRPRGFLTDRGSFALGPFRLTPHLVDHSAFDAYALLVEAGGRWLFYSAIFGHGRKAALFEHLLTDPPRVDTLLLKGTRIDERGGGERGALSERDVEEQALAVFRRAEGAVLALYSPQNLDRLITLYRAAKRAGRVFVLDHYAAAISSATERDAIPQASWSDVRVFVPQRQRIRVKETGQFERVAGVRSSGVLPEELAAISDRLVVTCRSSILAELERADCLTSAEALWSMWPGYLEQPSGVALRDRLDKLGIPLAIAHASGHATGQRFIVAISRMHV